MTVRFYKTPNGKEPVREWLMKQLSDVKKVIGNDIKTVEFGWPIGMPVVRKIEPDLWEVRSNLADSRIARVLFTVIGKTMVLLHGFIKKTQKIPKNDKDIAKKRIAELKKK